MTIRTILVDDEKLAIQGLQLRLQAFEDVEVIDTCSNGIGMPGTNPSSLFVPPIYGPG